jgi:hypothetical protein
MVAGDIFVPQCRIISFTGTRDGMTFEQFQYLRKLLLRHAPMQGHHGDCIGSDAQFHDLCRQLFGKAIEIIVHPPEDPTYRAFKHGDVIMEPKPYLERDRDVAKAGQLLIATPRQAAEVRRSGTWATTRYAKKAKRPVALITPKGHAHLLS